MTLDAVGPRALQHFILEDRPTVDPSAHAQRHGAARTELLTCIRPVPEGGGTNFGVGVFSAKPAGRSSSGGGFGSLDCGTGNANFTGLSDTWARSTHVGGGKEMRSDSELLGTA